MADSVKKEGIKPRSKAGAKRSFPTTKQEKSDLKKQRQMAKPHFNEISTAKSLWQRVSVKSLPAEERKQLVKQLMETIQGKILEIASRHDASRIIQTALKYGSTEDRTTILKELKANLVELCEKTYSMFLVKKLLKYGSKEDRKLIVKAMKGNVVKLATHNIAAQIIEDSQEFIMPSEYSSLRLEFYGKEFALFHSESEKSLKQILQKSPKKRTEVMQNLQKILGKMVDKQLLGMAFVQHLMWEYLEEATYDEKTSMIPNIRDAAAALLSTRRGAMVVVHCLAYGTPKDRKRVIKSLKGKVFDACNHPSGYLVLLSLMNVVDDTVSVQKSILPELTPKLLEVALHATGRKVILQLLSPGNKRYLTMEELKAVDTPHVPSPQNKEEMVVNYKKDSSTRRTELLDGWKGQLEEMIVQNVLELMKNPLGADVVVEAVKEFDSEDLLTAISSAIFQDSILSASEDNEEDMPVYEHAIGHRSIQRMVSTSAELASKIASEAPEKLVMWSKTNRGCFALLAVLKGTPTAKERKQVCTTLKSKKSELKKLASKSKGAELLLEFVQQ